MKIRLLSASLVLLLFAITGAGQNPQRGKNTVTIRGTEQDVYFCPAIGKRLDRKLLFVPGDAGWRGFVIVVADQLTSWEYDVYGLDTNNYLESFTRKGNRLKETDVMTDFRQMAEWIKGGSNERVTLMGWSEGAELCLLAAAAPDNRDTFDGLVTFGMGKTGILGWRWFDDLTFLTKKDPHEPKFVTTSYMAHVAPLPLLMIQSTHDEFVPTEEAKQLFATAREPKRFVSVEAQDHKFSGNKDEFFHNLRDGLEWIQQAANTKEVARPPIVRHN